MKTVRDEYATQDVYFSNYFENAVIRWDFKKVKHYVKFKGSREFEAVKGSGVVTQGWMDNNEITKEEYYNY